MIFKHPFGSNVLGFLLSRAAKFFLLLLFFSLKIFQKRRASYTSGDVESHKDFLSNHLKGLIFDLVFFKNRCLFVYF